MTSSKIDEEKRPALKVKESINFRISPEQAVKWADMLNKSEKKEAELAKEILFERKITVLIRDKDQEDTIKMLNQIATQMNDLLHYLEGDLPSARVLKQDFERKKWLEVQQQLSEVGNKMFEKWLQGTP